MADAAVLGIHPPCTVRIELGGWVQDWPWDMVDIDGERILIKGYVGLVPVLHCLQDPADRGEQGLCYYRYEHAQRLDSATWLFVGREDFTVTAGPPAPHSMQ